MNLRYTIVQSELCLLNYHIPPTKSKESVQTGMPGWPKVSKSVRYIPRLDNTLGELALLIEACPYTATFT
jgi:hypothetical protein